MSPADLKIKQVVLTSTQEVSSTSEGGAKGTKRTRKIKKGGAPLSVRFEKVGGQAGEPLPSPVTSAPVGGGATSPGTLVQLTASHVPGSSSTHAVGAVAPLTNSAAPIGSVAPAAAADPVAAVAKGGATANTNPRVILAKSKKKSKILLAAPKHGKTVELSGANPSKKRSKTAKKVHMSLKGLTKKMSNAKKIHHKVSKNSLEDIKKELVAAELIKADSKAPEDILRQMYTDFMVLKKRAL